MPSASVPPRRHRGAALVLALLAAGCSTTDWQQAPVPPSPGAGLAPWALPAGTEAVATLDQAWDPALASRFHFTP